MWTVSGLLTKAKQNKMIYFILDNMNTMWTDSAYSSFCNTRIIVLELQQLVAFSINIGQEMNR